MERSNKAIADYCHLEMRGSGSDSHVFIRGKDVRVIDIYLAYKRSGDSVSTLAVKMGLTADEIQEAIRYGEWHSDQVLAEVGLSPHQNRQQSIYSTAYSVARVLMPAMLFVFGILISIAFKGLFSIAVGIFCFILFLRFANEIPIFGWAWVKVFGRQDLWEWLRMTIAPVAIGVVGTYVTTTINRYQNQANIERSRNELISAYLSAYQPDKQLYSSARALVDARTAELTSTMGAASARDSCSTRPDSNWLSIHARSTLNQISSLEPPRDTNKTLQKRPILEFLKQSGLIRRGANIVDLSQADLTDSVLTWADLSDSCLRQINFIDYPATIQLASDLRHAKLDNSDFTGANLQRANLRYASLKNVDLRRSGSISRADLRGADLTGAVIDESTGIYGMIVNTKLISIDDHKMNWWYPLICNRSIQDALQWTFLCVDSIDWYDIPITKLPDFFDKEGRRHPIKCEPGRNCGYTDVSGRFRPLISRRGTPKIKVINSVPTL
jgi:hypothetical protein